MVAPTQARRKQEIINVKILICSIVVGIISWIVAKLFYDLFLNQWPTAIIIGLVFLLLAGSLAIAIFIVSSLDNTFEYNIVTGNSENAILTLLVLVVMLFLLATLFQWIYGLDFKKVEAEPTSYVFAIDDSGSMKGNDPNALRYSALIDVMDGVDNDFPYMVYGFSDYAYVLREMNPKSTGIPQITGSNNGGTAIKGTLETILDDYQSGQWDGGDNPRIILLTDGDATDMFRLGAINLVLKNYVKSGLSISTIGLGDVNDRLMDRIAKATGGVYLNVADALQLNEAMKAAANEGSSRDLFSTRYVRNLNVIYAIMRVVFLTILGIGIGYLSAVAYGQQSASEICIVISCISSFIGALIVEIGTSIIGMADSFCWILYWLLISIAVLTKMVDLRGKAPRRSRGRTYSRGRGHSSRTPI